MATESAFENVAKKLDVISSSFAQVAAAIDSFGRVMGKAIEAMGQQMARFVQYANPAVVMRFNMALQNAMSAMGRIFIPTLEKFTVIIQQIGNAIESLDPASKKLIAGLAGGAGLLMAFMAVAKGASLLLAIFSGGWIGIIVKLTLVLVGVFSAMSEGKELTQAFQEVLKAVGTVIQVLAQIFAVVFVPVIKVVANVLRQAIEFIAIAIRRVANLLGMNLPNYDPNAKTAQAVRQSQMTDIRGIASRAYTQTFGGAAGNVQDHILSENQKQTILLQDIKTNTSKGGTNSTTSPSFTPVQNVHAASRGRTIGRRIRDYNRDLLDRFRSVFGGG